MPNFTYTKIVRKTYPPYDIQRCDSPEALNMVTYRKGTKEIHVTVPPADDIRSSEAWSYPHITFVTSDDTNDHVYIGWSKDKKQIPVTSRGVRMMLSASEYSLFQKIVADMNSLYSYL